MKIFCQDESRFGLMPIKHKKITSFGVKPVGKCSFERENFWIYGATDMVAELVEVFFQVIVTIGILMR